VHEAETKLAMGHAMSDPAHLQPPRPAHERAPALRGTVRRVLLAITELRAGGAERVLSLLAEGLKAREVEPLVVCLEDEGPLAPTLKDQGIRVQALGSRRGYDPSTLWALRRIVWDANPDVLNAHDRWALLYLSLATQLMRSPPLVFSAHGLMYDEPARAPFRYRLAARTVSAATAVSEEVAARHGAYFGWKRSAQIVQNGVPEPATSPGARECLRAALSVKREAFLFLAVGNVRPEKGFEHLLQAAADLRQAVSKPFVVLVCGKMSASDYCTRLRQNREKLDLVDTVHFLGYRDDVPDLYAAADAFVLSSRSEGLPMVVLEAMMAGLPVVATRVGGVPDAVGDCGLLVEPERPRALAEGMGYLMDDGALAADLGRRGRERALHHYSLDRMVDRYIEVYERVAAEQPPGVRQKR